MHINLPVCDNGAVVGLQCVLSAGWKVEYYDLCKFSYQPQETYFFKAQSTCDLKCFSKRDHYLKESESGVKVPSPLSTTRKKFNWSPSLEGKKVHQQFGISSYNYNRCLSITGAWQHISPLHGIPLWFCCSLHIYATSKRHYTRKVLCSPIQQKEVVIL